jgi:hypothetical protein
MHNNLKKILRFHPESIFAINNEALSNQEIDFSNVERRGRGKPKTQLYQYH